MEMTEKEIQDFATALIERADRPDEFRSVLGYILRATRNVALQDAFNAVGRLSFQKNRIRVLAELALLKGKN